MYLEYKYTPYQRKNNSKKRERNNLTHKIRQAAATNSDTDRQAITFSPDSVFMEMKDAQAEELDQMLRNEQWYAGVCYSILTNGALASIS